MIRIRSGDSHERDFTCLGHPESARFVIQLNGTGPAGGHYEPASAKQASQVSGTAPAWKHHEPARLGVQMNGIAPA
jgi:hypothetical protein